MPTFHSYLTFLCLYLVILLNPVEVNGQSNDSEVAAVLTREDFAPYLYQPPSLFLTVEFGEPSPPGYMSGRKIVLEQEVSPFFTKSIKIDGRSYLAFVEKEENQLFIFDPESNELLKRVQFPKSNFGELRTFDIQKDSLILFTKSLGLEKRLHLANLEGEHLQTIDYSGKIDQQKLSIESGIIAPVIYFEGDLYFYQLPAEALNVHPDEKQSILGRLNVNTGAYEALPVYHPDSYYQRPYPLGYEFPFVERAGDEIVISFSGTPDIILYSLKNQEITLSVQSSSEYLDLERPPPAENGLPEQVIFNQNGAYGPVLYDSETGSFVRRVFVPGGDKKKSSLMVMKRDEKGFRVLKEELIPPLLGKQNNFLLDGKLYMQKEENLLSEQIILEYSIVDLKNFLN